MKQMKKIMFRIRKETATTENRKEEIHLTQGGTVHITTIIIDPEMKATVMIPQKTTTGNM